MQHIACCVWYFHALCNLVLKVLVALLLSLAGLLIRLVDLLLLVLLLLSVDLLMGLLMS